MCESRPTPLVDAMTRTEVLGDGTRVLIRPLLYSDRQELALGYQHLSPEGRRLRFFAAPRELSAADLDYLTRLDYDDHFAWAAFALDAPGRPGIGVARYVRDRQDPTRAEAAVTVLDEYQRRGLGTLLLVLLAQAAVERGVRTFVGHVLWENLDALQPLLEDLGARTVPEEPGVARVEVDLPVPVPPPAVDGFMRRLLRTGAALLRYLAD